MNIVHTHAGKDVEHMRDAIIADVTAWSHKKPQDDMSLVVARRIR